uniref:small, acid-soluble spore protein, alpha/beta type n=1 Tax=Priestia megaterium TaxID=1404 RepID=UPI0012B92BDC|nr:small, acid-soluble spore protein, alpha/beta type [Priestia megaterium]
MAKNKNRNTNELLVYGGQEGIDEMKYEIGSEFGVTVGGDASGGGKGCVGGEIRKGVVEMGEEQVGGGGL